MHGRYSSPRYGLWATIIVFLVVTFSTLILSLVLGYCSRTKNSFLESHTVLISDISSVKMWAEKGDLFFGAQYDFATMNLFINHKVSSSLLLSSLPKSEFSVNGSEVTVLVKKPNKENKFTECYYSDTTLQSPLKRISDFSIASECGSVSLYQPLYPVQNIQLFATQGANVTVDQLAWNGNLIVGINGSYDESVKVRVAIGIQKISRRGNNCNINVTSIAGSILLNAVNFAGKFDVQTLYGKVEVSGNITLILDEPNHKVGFTALNGTSTLFSNMRKGDISIYLAK